MQGRIFAERLAQLLLQRSSRHQALRHIPDGDFSEEKIKLQIVRMGQADHEYGKGTQPTFQMCMCMYKRHISLGNTVCFFLKKESSANVTFVVAHTSNSHFLRLLFLVSAPPNKTKQSYKAPLIQHSQSRF